MSGIGLYGIVFQVNSAFKFFLLKVIIQFPIFIVYRGF